MLMLVLYLSVKEVAMHVTLTGWHKTAGAAGAGAAGGTDPYTRTVADHTDRLARPIPAAAACPYQTGERAYEGARVCVCVCLSRLHRVYRRLIAVLHLSAAAALWRNGRLIEPQIFSSNWQPRTLISWLSRRPALSFRHADLVAADRTTHSTTLLV